jgi:uncharacterized protein (TIGR00730 family)
MVVTGAGPGIMAAGLEGAGRAMSFGISIRLPFETAAVPFMAADPKLVEMKYFFTRKLALMKESAAFVALPGGFGTLDELLELLTLIQTGKADPAPVVCLEEPGGTYWQGFRQFLETEVSPRRLIDPDDMGLLCITDVIDEAVAEVRGFYRNYHSMRYVGELLVLRLRATPTSDEMAAVSREFEDICVEGEIDVIDPLPPEVHDQDQLDLARIGFQFDRMHLARLRHLIDRLNSLPSAPQEMAPPPEAATESAAGLA